MARFISDKVRRIHKRKGETKRSSILKIHTMILEREDDELVGDVIVADIIAGKAHTCPAIKPVKEK